MNSSNKCDNALSLADMTSGMVCMDVPYICITLTHISRSSQSWQCWSTAAAQRFSDSELTQNTERQNEPGLEKT